MQGWVFDGALQPCRNWVHIMSLGVCSKPGHQEPLGCSCDPIRVLMLNMRTRFVCHRKAGWSGWPWELNVTGHCIWSTLREKLQNTENLYIKPVGFKHFSSKAQFEQKSLPQEWSRRQSNQTENQEINTKSKT